MRYDSDFGKTYDAAFFLTDCFFADFTEKNILSVYEDTDFMKKCLSFLRERIHDIPDILEPFAAVNSSDLSPVTEFLETERTNRSDRIDINTFKKLLAEDRDLFFDVFVKNIFGSDENAAGIKGDAERYIKAMDGLNKPAEFKLKLAYILNDFGYAVSVLCDCLGEIYKAVDELHSSCEKEILYAFEQIQSDLNKDVYSRELSFRPENSAKTVVSISLVNQFAVFNCFNGKKSVMLLGYKHMECFWNNGSSDKVDARRFIVTAGNETRIEIIDLIAEHGEITISTLAKIMNIPITTVGRHVSGLRNDNIIYISKRDGLQLFYSINTAFFRRLKVSLGEYADKTVNLANSHKQ